MTAPSVLDVLEELICAGVDPVAADLAGPRLVASAVMAPTVDALREFIGRAVCVHAAVWVTGSSRS